ncbi:transcription elongation factor B polypeptide 3 [Drosophila kikkawai]|uniref:Transcription elongation factor B polypeptide 3 n=1 Tax=Drosophila kikkawai TaxID=30033 RepID=A0A6P4I047_DROKI|nr:transcription elongation factor B polypeptide 3 [Drosophila kikkawai]
MNSTSNLADVVRHYQRSIEKHSDNEKRLVHCMNKLFNLPIKFEHLQETGIGKTVNALRKFNGEVGQSAKTLITKWKAMVTAEEGSSTEVPLAASSQEEDSGKSNGRRSSDEDLDQENKGSNSSSGEERQAAEHRSRQEERSDKSSRQDQSGSSKSHSKSSSDPNRKHKSSRHDKSKERDKDKEDHKEKKSNGEHKSRDSSQSNSTKSSRSDGHKGEHSKSKHEKEKPPKDKSSKHHKSSSKSSKRSHSPHRVDEESSKAKIPKTKAKSEEDSPDGFDSSMGANFDDVLGMLNMPMSSKKSTSGKSKSVAKMASSSSSTPVAPAAPSRDAFLSSRPTSTKKPELLAPSAKLEPLDPSIALELPTISNNYKPLPLNQTVMDVVFNQGGTQRSQASRFNESEALAQGISSKTMRTKIYSGVRTGQLLQVPSLFDLCTRILQKNLDALEYTGGVPFEILRTVLERATPQQLLNIEEYNPYLMDDSDILWQQHVQRHCRSQRREEMETWREMFLRCQEEKDRKLSSLAESIKASQKISEAPVRKTQLAFVDSMVKPPRSVMRKQEQYGTKSKLIATPAARVAALSSVTPNAAKVGDARLRVLAATRDTAQVAAAPRNKKAPLMAKTLQFMRGRHKR